MRPLRLALLVALTSCATSPEPDLRSPEIDARVTYYAGDPIGGPLPEEQALAFEARIEEALPVAGKLYLLTSEDGERYSPLSRHVRMIVAGGGAQPLVPNSLLTAGTQLATGEEATELAILVEELPASKAVLSATFEGMSLPGVTTQMIAAHAQPIELIGYRPAQRRFSVELWREDPKSEELSIAMILSDIGESLEDLEDGTPQVLRFPRQERLVLEATLAATDGSVAILAPARFDPSGRLSFLLVLEVGEERPTEADERLLAVTSDVREAAIAGTERRQQLLFDDLQRMRHQNSLAALTDEAHRRAALLELAGGAPITSELALMSNDEELTKLFDRIAPRAEDLAGMAGDVDAIAWLLEQEAVGMFVKAMSEQAMAPEYSALLLQHTGEAGRFSGALETALGAARSVQEFYSLILEENRIALEDSSPAARVRAHDWLCSKQMAVADYDPLSERPDRRAALQAWANAQAAVEDVQADEGVERP